MGAIKKPPAGMREETLILVEHAVGHGVHGLTLLVEALEFPQHDIEHVVPVVDELFIAAITESVNHFFLLGHLRLDDSMLAVARLRITPNGGGHAAAP